MKKLILSLAVIAMLASCKKKTPIVVPPEPEKEKLAKDINVYISGFTRFTDPAPQGNGIYNFLGYGYDVTDKYNNQEAVRLNVIDVSSFVAANPTRFDLGWPKASYSINKIATSAEDFSSQLSNDFLATKGLKLFRNTVKSSSSWDNFLDRKYVYGYYSKVVEQKRIKFMASASGSYLSTNFVQDLAALDPAALVQRYGTHVLQDITLGASFSVIYQASTAGQDKHKISAAGLRYTLNKGFGLFTGELDPIDLAALNANKGATIYYIATGGDLSKLQWNQTFQIPFFSINDWHSSATEDKSKLIRIAEDGLVPLEDFIADAKKKAVVKAYIAQYIRDKEVKLEN